MNAFGKDIMYRPLLTTGLLGLCCLSAGTIQAAEPYSWQRQQATVLPNGDLQWAPEPYRFQPGASVRYIDYDNGNDNNSGASKQQAWKHHPWDRDAGANAAACSGPISYVFKNGVIYRGQLFADESGTAEDPIRLLSDPDWGEGRPWFYGSERLPAAWVRATSVDHPERLPDPDQVWAIDLKAAGIDLHNDGPVFTLVEPHPVKGVRTKKQDPSYQGLHAVTADGTIMAMHLARTPDWQPMGENYAMDYWHVVDEEVERKTPNGKRIAIGFKDSIWADGSLPVDYFTGGFIWMPYRSLMGGPTPRRIPDEAGNKRGKVPFFEPATGSLMHGHPQYGHGKGGLPYMIDNLPQFLDSPGEFYLDTTSGILFLQTDGSDPNRMHLEYSTDRGTIEIVDQSHVEIGGFGFGLAHGDAVFLQGAVESVTVHNCVFRNSLDRALVARQDNRAETFKLMDRITVRDCDFQDIGSQCIDIEGTWQWNDPPYRGILDQADILRNRVQRTGIRHRGSIWSNVAAITLQWAQRGEVAGNIVRSSFGSGIVVFGGKNGSTGKPEAKDHDVPLIRILVHHNKTEDTALGVNDYGGFALWQGGSTYAWSNNIGNSPGHMPAGLWSIRRPLNLSYPLYLDGAFKQYCFNNIIWGRSTDKGDPYSNTTPAYWMVFGFLNQFTNNTIYRQAEGMGGSSGNRNDIVSNLFVDISETFIVSNRIGDPSLVGGGDDSAASGLRGIPTLAFARNLFHGDANAGYLMREKEMKQSGLDQAIDADTIEKLSQQMQDFPMRIGELGRKVEQPLIVGAPEGPITELTEDVDFHPTPGSPAIDAGGIYFVPWSLYGTVGEWGFAENRAAPDVAIDYHWYMAEAHYDRQMYEQIPSFDLRIDGATVDDYVPGPSEDWIDSAMRFDGRRVARMPDASMRQDLKINMGLLDAASKRDVPIPLSPPWQVDEPSGEKKRGQQSYSKDDWLTYPAERRKTLIITTQNLLLEAIVQSDKVQGVIIGKHDGQSGYQLAIDGSGKAVFSIAAGGKESRVTSAMTITDGSWHHVLAEVDRASGAMRIYVDGKPAGEALAALAADVSIDTRADVLAGADGFTGAIDFLRVCRGTLADSHTDIAELYEWQSNGPFRYDFAGKSPQGRRDVGALEFRD